MAIDVRRRKFIAVLSGALVGRAIPAYAQQATRTYTVGVLQGLGNDVETQARITAFERGLEAEGWSVGKSLRIEYRYTGGDSNTMRALAKELAELKPDCILGHSTPVVRTLMEVTRTIPIVFVSVSDPIGSGFVASMARPAGNMTGFTIFPATITGKYLSMLKEMVPQLVRVAILYNPDTAPATGTFFLTPFINAAKEFKIQPITAQVRNPAEIESATAKLGSEPNSGLIVMPDNFTAVHRKLIISLAAQFRIPTIYPYRYFAEEGGLLSEGANTSDLFRRAAKYVSRVLRGAKPADLPVQAPTKFELVINLRAAKALGIVIPKILLASADRVIE
jgi:putative tryptophan/tyrosine transport system substrate-binding protein